MDVSSELLEGCGSCGADGNAVGDSEHWERLSRFAGCVGTQVPILLCVFLFPAVGGCGLYGFFGSCVGLSIALPLLFANFRPVRHRVIVYDVLWISAAFCIAFGLSYRAMGFVAGEKELLGPAVEMFCLLLKILLTGFSGALLVGAGILAGSRMDRWIYAGSVRRGKPCKWLWHVKKANEFIGRHPSLVLVGNREFAVLAIRYVLVGMALSLTVLGMVSVVDIASRVAEDPAWERNFEIDSFAGEKFGRVLSGDVERMKMSEPIGVIDEVMLVADGNPEKRLTRVYGLKYLGDLSDGEADALAEEVCASLRKMTGFELKNVPLRGRDGFRREIRSRKAHAYVKWDRHFFQNGKVLRFNMELPGMASEDPDLEVREVMGHKIGEPVTGGDRPKTPFWKFERIVSRCASNGISDGIYAVRDVASLSLEDAVKELEEARKEIENLHHVKMFKTVDGDCLKQYDCYGRNVSVSLKLEYLKVKQIRYAVLAEGDWADEIHAMKN